MSCLFLSAQLLWVQGLGTLAGALVLAWVLLRLVTLPTGASVSWLAWAGMAALFGVLGLATAMPMLALRGHGAPGEGTARQLRWVGFVLTGFMAWVAWQGAGPHAAIARRWAAELAAGMALLAATWVAGAAAPGPLGLFLVFELALTLLLLLLAYTQLAGVPLLAYAAFRRAELRAGAEQALVWVVLLLLWSSALALLLVLWACAGATAAGLSLEWVQRGVEDQRWAHGAAPVLWVTEATLAASVLVKLLLAPAQFALVQLYGRLGAAALVVYLAGYYVYLLPLALGLLLGLGASLAPLGSLTLAGGAVPGLFLLVWAFTPAQDFRPTFALSTLVTLALLALTLAGGGA